MIGFELEAAVDDMHHSDLVDALDRIHPEIDVGTDGSVLPTGLSPDAEFSDGAEIRTPPLPLEQGLKVFEKILVVMGRFSANKKLVTNASCGLHVNLSEAHCAERFDRFCRFYAHVATHFPEQDILKLFNRTTNTYCHPLFTRAGQKKADWQELQALAMSGQFGNHKYHSIGLHNGKKDNGYEPQHRRIEFRCLGNKDYHSAAGKLGIALDAIMAAANYAFEQCLLFKEEGVITALIDNGISKPAYVACSN